MQSDAGFIPSPTTTRRLDACLEFLLIALLFVMPAARGTVNNFGEFFAIVFGAVIAVLLAVRRIIIPERTAGGWAVWIPIVLFFLLAVAQLVPLPAAMMKAISPGTYASKAELLNDLPAAISHMPITFYALGTHHDLRIVFLTVTVFATVLTIDRDPRRMHRLLIVITLIGGTFALLSLAQCLTKTTRVYWLIDIGEIARAGPFVNHSHYGQFMNLSIAAALALLLSKPQRRFLLPLILFIALGLGTIVLSKTRGGVISAMAALIFSLGMVALVHRKPVLAALFIVSLVAAPIFAWKFRDDGRLQIARDVWTMSGKFGATGTGLGTFEWAYTPFDTTGTLNTATHADNEYVQMLAETGFGGLAIVLIFAGLVWWHWLRAVRSGDTRDAGIAIGAGYGLLAVMTHSLSDFGQHLAANGCLSAALCGLVINVANSQRKDWPSARRGFRIVMAVGVIIVAAWAVIGADRACRAEATWELAENLADRLEDANWNGPQNETDQLRTLLDETVDLEPGNVKYRYRRALYNWRMAAHAFDRGSPERAAAARDVVDQLNAARVVCPTYGLTYSVLGQIELSALGLPIGHKHLEIATRLEPNDPIVWFAAGRADARRGDLKSANQKFKHAMALDYSVIQRAIDFYLDELGAPDPAIELAGNSSYLLRMVGNAMLARPAYADRVAKVMGRTAELVIEEARREPTPVKLAAAGWHLAQMGRFVESEDFYSRALQQDPQPEWRLFYAGVLIKLNRLDDAEAQLRAVQQQAPGFAGLADVRKYLDSARAKPPTTAK